jgi:hypothetical protein
MPAGEHEVERACTIRGSIPPCVEHGMCHEPRWQDAIGDVIEGWVRRFSWVPPRRGHELRWPLDKHRRFHAHQGRGYVRHLLANTPSQTRTRDATAGVWADHTSVRKAISRARLILQAKVSCEGWQRQPADRTPRKVKNHPSGYFGRPSVRTRPTSIFTCRVSQLTPSFERRAPC